MLILIYLNIVLFPWTDLPGFREIVLLCQSVCIPTAGQYFYCGIKTDFNVPAVFALAAISPNLYG